VIKKQLIILEIDEDVMSDDNESNANPIA